MVGLTKDDRKQIKESNIKAIRRAIAKHNWKSVEDMVEEDALSVLKQRFVDEMWIKSGINLHKKPTELTDKEILKLIKVTWKQ